MPLAELHITGWNHWSQNQDWIDHSFLSRAKCLKPIALACTWPLNMSAKEIILTWFFVKQKLHDFSVSCWLFITFQKSSKKKALPSVISLYWIGPSNMAAKRLHFRTTDARSSLHVEISGWNVWKSSKQWTNQFLHQDFREAIYSLSKAYDIFREGKDFQRFT